MPQVSQESITTETLKLLETTVAYLRRLPVVPMTYSLCKAIDAHLADPSVLAAKREALDAERLASTRVAQILSPAGALAMEVTVEQNTVTCRLPEVWMPDGVEDKLLKALRCKGVTLDLKAMESENNPA